MIIVDWFVAGIAIGGAYILGVITGEILEVMRQAKIERQQHNAK